MKEGSAGGSATNFTWDIYLFGAEAGADKGLVNISNLTADQDFSSPDGLVFSPATGFCWIQPHDDSYTDVTNCVMLAALPGTVPTRSVDRSGDQMPVVFAVPQPVADMRDTI